MKEVFTFITDDDGYHVEFDTDWSKEHADYIAEDAAEYYYDNCDGWESTWPKEIEVFCNKESLGKFIVEREYEPTFSAGEI